MGERRVSLMELAVVVAGIVLLTSAVPWAAGQSDGDRGRWGTDNLLSWRDAVKPWYERLYYFTAWPEQDDFAVLGERADIEYSIETLVDYALREGVLRENWTERLLRLKQWIPKGVVGSVGLDAYLFRQSFENGTLHICDTRGNMVIAFAPERATDLLDDPRASLNKIVAKLFKLSFPTEPEKTPLKQDELTGMYWGRIGYGLAPVTGQQQAGARPAFMLLYMLGSEVAIFEFQKEYVPGCVIESRYPLFGEAPAKFGAAQAALEKLRGFTHPIGQDIPELVQLLAELPEGPTREGYLENPYAHRKLSDAKVGVLRAIKAAIESIETGASSEVKSIREALTVEKYFAEPTENAARSHLWAIKRTAIDALYRIRTDEAALLHLEIVDAAKDASSRRKLLGELGKYPLFRGQVEQIYEEEKNAGRRMNKYELYERLSQEIRRDNQAALRLSPWLTLIGVTVGCLGVLLLIGMAMKRLTNRKV